MNTLSDQAETPPGEFSLRECFINRDNPQEGSNPGDIRLPIETAKGTVIGYTEESLEAGTCFSVIGTNKSKTIKRYNEGQMLFNLRDRLRKLNYILLFNEEAVERGLLKAKHLGGGDNTPAPEAEAPEAKPCYMETPIISRDTGKKTFHIRVIKQDDGNSIKYSGAKRYRIAALVYNPKSNNKGWNGEWTIEFNGCYKRNRRAQKIGFFALKPGAMKALERGLEKRGYKLVANPEGDGGGNKPPADTAQTEAAGIPADATEDGGKVSIKSADARFEAGEYAEAKRQYNLLLDLGGRRFLSIAERTHVEANLQECLRIEKDNYHPGGIKCWIDWERGCSVCYDNIIAYPVVLETEKQIGTFRYYKQSEKRRPPKSRGYELTTELIEGSAAAAEEPARAAIITDADAKLAAGDYKAAKKQYNFILNFSEAHGGRHYLTPEDRAHVIAQIKECGRIQYDRMPGVDRKSAPQADTNPDNLPECYVDWENPRDDDPQDTNEWTIFYIPVANIEDGRELITGIKDEVLGYLFAEDPNDINARWQINLKRGQNWSEYYNSKERAVEALRKMLKADGFYLNN